jgi:hypothetical protein
MISAGRRRPIADLQRMTRRAFAGKRELTPPLARLDQRSNLSPCLPHGPYAFLAKMNQFHVVPATRPCRRAEKTGAGRRSKGRAFATKNPANAGLFNFRGRHISKYCQPQIRGQHRICENGEYLNLRQSPGCLHGTWAGALKAYVLTPSILAVAFSIGVAPRLKRLQ